MEQRLGYVGQIMGRRNCDETAMVFGYCPLQGRTLRCGTIQFWLWISELRGLIAVRSQSVWSPLTYSPCDVIHRLYLWRIRWRWWNSLSDSIVALAPVFWIYRIVKLITSGSTRWSCNLGNMKITRSGIRRGRTMDVKNHDFCPKTLLLKQNCHDAKCTCAACVSPKCTAAK